MWRQWINGMKDCAVLAEGNHVTNGGLQKVDELIGGQCHERP